MAEGRGGVKIPIPGAASFISAFSRSFSFSASFFSFLSFNLLATAFPAVAARPFHPPSLPL